MIEATILRSGTYIDITRHYVKKLFLYDVRLHNVMSVDIHSVVTILRKNYYNCSAQGMSLKFFSRV